MKKICLGFLVLFALTSCKKDYVCECTVSPGNITYKGTIKGVSKKTAKDVCVSTSDQQDDPMNPGNKITVTTNCAIK
ncbi:MAG: hypothetical protein N3F09_01575 [Bacteroidia bacterium]|nr:hypothetical protein [Bacteroidia bacterium]